MELGPDEMFGLSLLLQENEPVLKEFSDDRYRFLYAAVGIDNTKYHEYQRQQAEYGEDRGQRGDNAQQDAGGHRPYKSRYREAECLFQMVVNKIVPVLLALYIGDNPSDDCNVTDDSPLFCLHSCADVDV